MLCIVEKITQHKQQEAPSQDSFIYGYLTDNPYFLMGYQFMGLSNSFNNTFQFKISLEAVSNNNMPNPNTLKILQQDT